MIFKTMQIWLNLQNLFFGWGDLAGKQKYADLKKVFNQPIPDLSK